MRIRGGSYQLPADAFVVRGGRMKLPDLARAIKKCEKEAGMRGFSVYAADMPSVDDVCLAAQFLPHPHVCWTTVGVILAVSGVELVPTREAPHYTVVVPDTTPETLYTLGKAFPNQCRNPAPTQV